MSYVKSSSIQPSTIRFSPDAIEAMTVFEADGVTVKGYDVKPINKMIYEATLLLDRIKSLRLGPYDTKEMTNNLCEVVDQELEHFNEELPSIKLVRNEWRKKRVFYNRGY